VEQQTSVKSQTLVSYVTRFWSLVDQARITPALAVPEVASIHRLSGAAGHDGHGW
jgi:hypothetical protein